VFSSEVSTELTGESGRFSLVDSPVSLVRMRTDPLWQTRQLVQCV
jgi:hypothetical protein